MESEKTFGKKLKDLRKKKGVTQNQLAESLEISNGAIGNWEINTRQPDHDMLVKIADYFSVSIDYLLGRESDKALSLKANTVISIGRGGEKRIYEIDEEDAEFVDTFLKKVAKKK